MAVLHTCVCVMWVTDCSALVWKGQMRVESLCMIPHQTQCFSVKVVLVSSASEADFPCGEHEIVQIVHTNVITKKKNLIFNLLISFFVWCAFLEHRGNERYCLYVSCLRCLHDVSLDILLHHDSHNIRSIWVLYTCKCTANALILMYLSLWLSKLDIYYYFTFYSYCFGYVLHFKVQLFQKMSTISHPLPCQLALYTVLRHDASHIASGSSDSFIAWRYNRTESLTWSSISPRCGSSPRLTSLPCLLHLSSPVPFIASIHLSLLYSPLSHLCREMATGESHFCPPPQKPHTVVVVVVAGDGESEIGRQKEIDFCLPPSQTLLTLTITITIPPLLLSPLQISAGRL